MAAPIEPAVSCILWSGLSLPGNTSGAATTNSRTAVTRTASRDLLPGCSERLPPPYEVLPCRRVGRIKLYLDAVDLLLGRGLIHALMMAAIYWNGRLNRRLKPASEWSFRSKRYGVSNESSQDFSAKRPIVFGYCWKCPGSTTGNSYF